jgi:hypothetical protein
MSNIKKRLEEKKISGNRYEKFSGAKERFYDGSEA